jgi:hypothetical protein
METTGGRNFHRLFEAALLGKNEVPLDSMCCEMSSDRAYRTANPR